MPFDRKKYPREWPEISRRIRERSGGRCECDGLCGLHRGRRCVERNGEKAKWAKGKVVLTVAHLGIAKEDGLPGDPNDKMDVRDENLRAMCQRCHCRLDIPEHVANAKKTREKKKWKDQLPLSIA